MSLSRTRWIRCGTCSVCRVALEVPEDQPKAPPRPRSPKVRRQGHRHRQPWQVVPDGEDSDRAWHDLVPGGRALFGPHVGRGLR